MALYNGSRGNDIFLLASHRTGDTIWADGDATIDDPFGFNIIVAGRGNDQIHGGWGRDVIFAGAGDDVVFGFGQTLPFGNPASGGFDIRRDGDDLIDGGGGNDTIHGGGGDDRLLGGTGNDTLYGGTGNDIIRGGAGDDVISSGSGTDQLWGGAGADVFLYRYLMVNAQQGNDADGVDTIHDFESGIDRIDLRGYSITGGVEQVQTDDGLELHFSAIGSARVIALLDVASLAEADIIL
ncbi:calcium-binding protein [Roseomonas sp. 18066]|uniref:calcium-binding protein n=1 Tax=Roseomonas sp. 18066 TaxID=2681412 RepID=UPI0013589CD6|nr:calcium-binding protein [Roseomonas sp. 18066]